MSRDARTVALRTSPVRIAISPKKSPSREADVVGVHELDLDLAADDEIQRVRLLAAAHHDLARSARCANAGAA